MMQTFKEYCSEFQGIIQDDNLLKMWYKQYFISEVERDIRCYNPSELRQKYIEFFSKKKFETKKIKKGRIFYRGRIGKIIVPGSISDLNTKFIIPYYGEEIKAAPPLYTNGGRFNRAGISYLYVASNIKTCLAEIHSQVGQECTIAKFKCIENTKFIDLSNYGKDVELEILYSILTEPIHEEIKYKYLITQFLAEILMEFNSKGLYFKSIQSEGYNLVCYDHKIFELIQFSERLYKVKKIEYVFDRLEDSAEEYSKHDDSKSISSYNESLEKENENKIEYLQKMIEKRKSKQNKVSSRNDRK